MEAHAAHFGTPFSLTRIRAALAAAGAAVLGAAPHVLHHVGPFAGAAVLAGASGKLLFGAAGFVLAVPLLLRLRRRDGTWRVPAGVLAPMVVVFTVSTFVIGPALAGEEDSRPAGVTPAEHEAHHEQEKESRR